MTALATGLRLSTFSAQVLAAVVAAPHGVLHRARGGEVAWRVAGIEVHRNTVDALCNYGLLRHATAHEARSWRGSILDLVVTEEGVLVASALSSVARAQGRRR